MKKIAIFCSAMALLGLASCDDKSDLGVEQKNAQENVLSAGGVTVTPQSSFAGTSIDLSAMPEGNTLDVLTYTIKDALPAGAHMAFRMELGSDANYSKSTTIDLTPGANAKAPYTITAGDLDNAVFTLFGKEPTTRTVYTRVAAYIVNGTELVRIRENDSEAWFMGKSMAMTPVDLELSELEYYFVSSLNGMSITGAAPMTHGDKHPYDDPVYTYVIDVTASDVASGNVKWAIAPKSAVESDNASLLLGAADGVDLTAMEGELKQGGQALEFNAPAKYQVRINVQKMTYEVGFANEQLYVWTPQLQFRSLMGLLTGDYVNYDGIAYIGGVWKLTGQTDMLSLQIGLGEGEGKLAFGKTTKPIAIPAAGANKLYRIQANLTEMTYNVTAAESIGVVGGNNNWGNDISEGVPAPADAVFVDAGGNHNVWTATVTFSDPKNLEFKIRANNYWNSDEKPSFDLGQNNDAEMDGDRIPLSFGGANLKVPEVGTYEITVDFSIGATVGHPHPYYLTIVKK